MTIRYISGSMATQFEAIDDTGRISVPVSEIAPGAIGILVVFDTEENAKAYGEGAEVAPFDVGDEP